MQYLFRLSQRRKPMMPVDRYGPLLRSAFDELERAPDFPDIDDIDPHDPEIRAFFQAMAVYWERMNARLLDLEAVRPDDRLSRVHEESIKFFRGSLKVMNVVTEQFAAAMSGDLMKHHKKAAEAESWGEVLLSVSQKLGDALWQVYDRQPTLFRMLDLRPDLLSEFDSRFRATY